MRSRRTSAVGRLSCVVARSNISSLGDGKLVVKNAVTAAAAAAAAVSVEKAGRVPDVAVGLVFREVHTAIVPRVPVSVEAPSRLD